MLLLVASCHFYATLIPRYLFILFALIVVDYSVAILLQKTSGLTRKIIFLVSIFANSGALFIFKYYDFFITGLNLPFPLLKLILPLGLSFHTFQSMGYIVDVYTGKINPEKHLGVYALFVMFFPQLVAGPIERASNMLPQFHTPIHFSWDNLISGLKLMLWGFFKKMVIADRLAFIANQVFNNPHDYLGAPLVIGTFAFGIQIYCDFSGYTDIAIGAARTFGYHMSLNFSRPYFSKTIREFWRRWHISLSSWFRDYVYIPLGGNQVSRLKSNLNLLAVFLLSGFWHGANWTFLVWGGLHGLYMLAGKHLRFGRLLTFIFVNFAWIFFRANNLSDAFYISTHLHTGLGSLVRSILKLDFFSSFAYVFRQGSGLGISLSETWILLVGLAILFIYELVEEHRPSSAVSAYSRFSLLFYFVLALIVLNFSTPAKSTFIYFQF